MASSNCEHCAYYVYDEEYECYNCEINLDEDDMIRFMQGTNDSCHYFKLYDEYKIVRKQN
ncbi:MAG TPA: hypothetical protein GX401_09510 [Clostridiales bacterium]|nr:hypothetical protein [Clostridiales bacterium]